MKKKLDEQFLRSVPFTTGKGKQAYYTDIKMAGFGLCVGNKTKTFYRQREIDGKTVRTKIGCWPTFSVARAKQEAEELGVAMQKGINPNKEKKKLRAKKEATLQGVLNEYRKGLKAQGKVASYDEYEKILNRHLKDWLPKSLDQITPNMVKDRHQDIGKKSARSANKVFRIVRALYNHYRIDHPEMVNPVEVLRQKKLWFKEEARTVSLAKDHEFKTWYDAAMKQENKVIRNALLFALFNGLRRNEALSLAWADVDFEDDSFIIRKTKNKKPHTLPLTSYTRVLLKEMKTIATNKWVFPSTLSKSGHITEPKKVMKAINSDAALPETIRTHDLRRTFGTIGGMRLPQYALKRLLNHSTKGDVTSIYVNPSAEQLREPMEQMTKILMEKCGAKLENHIVEQEEAKETQGESQAEI